MERRPDEPFGDRDVALPFAMIRFIGRGPAFALLSSGRRTLS
jgi:hypothetical protein